MKTGFRYYTYKDFDGSSGYLLRYDPDKRVIRFGAFGKCSCYHTSEVSMSNFNHNGYYKSDIFENDTFDYNQVMNRVKNNYSFSNVIPDRVVDPKDTDYEKYLKFKDFLLEWESTGFDPKIYKKRLHYPLVDSDGNSMDCTSMSESDQEL
jgi:hypothetical protein